MSEREYLIAKADRVNKSGKNAALQMRRIANRPTDNTVAQEYSRKTVNGDRKGARDVMNLPTVADDGVIWLGGNPGKYRPSAKQGRAHRMAQERRRTNAAIKQQRENPYW